MKQANQTLTRIMVVEGYMDVIALHQAGLPIAVATLGTATTPEHTEVLFRAAPDVVFCFDGDRAGRAAAWKALESALPRLRDGRQAYFLFLPDGEDPDSLVRKEGKEGFEKRIKEAMPLSDYFFNELSHDVEMGSLDGRARLAERARPLIAKLPDGAFRDLMAQELEKRSGARAMLPPEPAAHRAVQRPVAVQRSLVRSAISLLLAQPALADEVEQPYGFLRLDKPGVELLAELLDTVRAPPRHQPGHAGGAFRRAAGISLAAEADGGDVGRRTGGAARRIFRCAEADGGSGHHPAPRCAAPARAARAPGQRRKGRAARTARRASRLPSDRGMN